MDFKSPGEGGSHTKLVWRPPQAGAACAPHVPRGINRFAAPQPIEFGFIPIYWKVVAGKYWASDPRAFGGIELSGT
jgi:hypothetical protein